MINNNEEFKTEVDYLRYRVKWLTEDRDKWRKAALTSVEDREESLTNKLEEIKIKNKATREFADILLQIFVGDDEFETGMRNMINSLVKEMVGD